MEKEKKIKLIIILFIFIFLFFVTRDSEEIATKDQSSIEIFASDSVE
ncbi:hypothetical protein [Vallitalea okinawensis]|nr:hypothetical protein [Vallitalea okinawensis]